MIDAIVQSHFDAYRNAVQARDLDAFITLYAHDVRVFDLWGTFACDGHDAWRRPIGAWFASLGEGRVEVAFDDVRIHGDEPVAAVDAFIHYRNVAADGSLQNAMRNRLTWLLEKRATGWTIVHEHTSAPLDPTTSKAMFA